MLISLSLSLSLSPYSPNLIFLSLYSKPIIISTLSLWEFEFVVYLIDKKVEKQVQVRYITQLCVCVSYL